MNKQELMKDLIELQSRQKYIEGAIQYIVGKIQEIDRLEEIKKLEEVKEKIIEDDDE